MSDEPRPLCTRCEITLSKPPSSLCSGCLADEIADRDEEPEYENDDCPTCEGRGTVNPLTRNLPADFLCLGTTTCPRCDGDGIDR